MDVCKGMFLFIVISWKEWENMGLLLFKFVMFIFSLVVFKIDKVFEFWVLIVNK